MVRALRTIGEYEAAVQERAMLAYEEQVRNGEIEIATCPDCGEQVPTSALRGVGGSHEWACYPSGGYNMTQATPRPWIVWERAEATSVITQK